MTPQHEPDQSVSTARMPKRRIALIAAAVTFAVTAGAVAIGTVGTTHHTTTADPSTATADLATAHVTPKTMRTLVVATGAEPRPSTPGTAMHGLRLAGTIPTRAVVATVLTDEDCAPDGAGVSHCRNTLRLPNGAKLTVRHPHRMMDVPCMTPGEHVRVTRAA